MGIEAISESVELIKAGNAPRIPQDESKATYEPLCDDKVAAIDWSKPAQEVYNLIRGCDPQPGAYVDTLEGKIRFYQAGFKREKVEKEPGTILAIEQSGIEVAAPGGVITLGKVRPERGARYWPQSMQARLPLNQDTAWVRENKLKGLTDTATFRVHPATKLSFSHNHLFPILCSAW